MMDLNTKITLNNGVKIPAIGLGTYLSKPGNETINAVACALDVGYRHIDTAAMYNNEKEVGIAVKNSSDARDKVFVTTKVWNSDHGYAQTMKAFDKSMKNLDLDYIDLYLIHWPVSKLRADTWKALEKIYRSGKCRAIGVSNYTIRHLEELLNNSEIKPAVNQVEFHPWLYQKELLEFCTKKQIYIQAYTPLTRGKKLNDPRLMEIALKYSKTPAQILIRWALQINTIVLPKSVREEKIIENANVFDFEISDEDIDFINSFNENLRFTWDPSDII